MILEIFREKSVNLELVQERKASYKFQPEIKKWNEFFNNFKIKFHIAFWFSK